MVLNAREVVLAMWRPVAGVKRGFDQPNTATIDLSL